MLSVVAGYSVKMPFAVPKLPQLFAREEAPALSFVARPIEFLVRDNPGLSTK